MGRRESLPLPHYFTADCRWGQLSCHWGWLSHSCTSTIRVNSTVLPRRGGRGAPLLCMVTSEGQGQLSTMCQVAVHTMDICMVFGGNMSLGHNVGPGCHKTMDPHMAPNSSMGPDIPIASGASRGHSYKHVSHPPHQ